MPPFAGAAAIHYLDLPGAYWVACAAMFGAVLGLVVYGVYDLTNYSTLAQWPAMVTLADLVWGTFACGVIAAGVYAVTAR